MVTKCCLCDRKLSFSEVKCASWTGMKKFCEVCLSTFKEAKEAHPGGSDDEIIRSIKARWMETGRVIMKARGLNAQLELLEDRVRIVRKGSYPFPCPEWKDDKEIPLLHVSSVQLRKSERGGGYIQFAYMGGQEAKEDYFEALMNENTVGFDDKQRPAFERLHSAVKERMGIASEGK